MATFISNTPSLTEVRNIVVAKCNQMSQMIQMSTLGCAPTAVSVPFSFAITTFSASFSASLPRWRTRAPAIGATLAWLPAALAAGILGGVESPF